jgi:hypothetical protein
MSKSNEAKYETLMYIDEVGFASSSEIAYFRRVTHGCQSTLLRRYWKFGLLHRASGVGKEKIYTLSNRGKKRLAWLSDQFETKLYTRNFLKPIKICKVKKDNELDDFLKNVMRTRCRLVRTERDYILIERI